MSLLATSAAVALGQPARLQDRARWSSPSRRCARHRRRSVARRHLRSRVGERRRFSRLVRPACASVTSSIQVRDAADDAAAQEADQQHEDDAEHQLPRRAEIQRRLQEVLQEQPDGGADQRPEQRAAAADRGLHHELAGGLEGEGIRRHERLQHAEQPAGKTGIGGRDHEGGELVAVDVVADRGCARSGLSRIALRIAPTGERTMRSAITMPTK